MNKTSTKRKIKKEELTEMAPPRKRLKISEIIQNNIVQEENNNLTHFNYGIAKRRNKLLTAMHLKKRYKYYCKKHDTTYLVQSARERVKNASKENRNKFIQSFRTLNVSANSDVSINENSVRIANNDRNSSKRKDILTNNQLEFSANADVVLKENPLVTEKSLPTLTDSQTNLIRNSAVFDENKDEDSDFGDDYEEASFRNRKIVKCLIVKKNSESNIIFSKDEDFSESDFDDETSDCDCDCYYHENFKNNFHNYEYESSSDDDMKSLSDILLNESSFRENKKSKLTL